MAESTIGSRTAAAQVAGTAEMVENIMLHAHLEDVLRCERVSHFFYNVIRNSPSLQTHTLQTPEVESEYLEVSTNSGARSCARIAASAKMYTSRQRNLQHGAVPRNDEKVITVALLRPNPLVFKALDARKDFVLTTTSGELRWMPYRTPSLALTFNLTKSIPPRVLSMQIAQPPIIAVRLHRVYRGKGFTTETHQVQNANGVTVQDLVNANLLATKKECAPVVMIDNVQGWYDGLLEQVEEVEGKKTVSKDTEGSDA